MPSLNNDALTNGLITVRSSGSVHETVQRLMIALDRRGMIVYAHIDHAKEAAAVNIAIRPTHLFVVGYREADSPLLAQNQLLGIELPLRILVWEDAGGAVLLTYTDPAWLGGRYGMKEISSQLAAMGVSLAGIAEEAKKL